MKKYLNLLPLLAFPYFFFPFTMLLWGLLNTFGDSTLLGNDIVIFIITGVMLFAPIIWSLAVSVTTAVRMRKNIINPSQAGRVTLIIKGCTVPAFAINNILIILACLLGIWGLGIILFLLFVNGLTLLCTGIISCRYIKVLKSENIIPDRHSVLRYIASFIMFADAIQVICLFVKQKNKQYKITEKISDIVSSEINKKDEATA